MYILAAGIVILLIVLAGADLFLAQFNADELSNMGFFIRHGFSTPAGHFFINRSCSVFHLLLR